MTLSSGLESNLGRLFDVAHTFLIRQTGGFIFSRPTFVPLPCRPPFARFSSKSNIDVRAVCHSDPHNPYVYQTLRPVL